MSDDFRLRSIAAAVYVPSLLFGLGQGAVTPVIVLSALELHASPGTALLCAALVGLGQLIADLPAGQLVGRVGERNAMQIAVVVASVGLLACIVAPNLLVFGLGATCLGLSWSVWNLARQLYITEAVPYAMRGRAMSMLGGVQRIGMFVGPFLAAAIIHFAGLAGAYWLHVTVAVIAGIALRAIPPPPNEPTGRAERQSVLVTVRILRDHLPVLRTVGLSALMVSAVRAARPAVIPLWAAHLGLDATTTSLIFGVSGILDVALFYPSGYAMDRFGRRWVAATSMAVLGISFLLLPLTGSTLTLALDAALMGFGNGMSAGVVLVLGADSAPPSIRSQFLGAFRLWADSGMLLGPVMISVITASAALGPASLVVGVLGWVGASALIRWTPSGREVSSPGSAGPDSSAP